ncbi:hypothetical protein IWX49DRAFT_243168 [Phyllosticta citricarpa]
MRGTSYNIVVALNILSHSFTIHPFGEPLLDITNKKLCICGRSFGQSRLGLLSSYASTSTGYEKTRHILCRTGPRPPLDYGFSVLEYYYDQFESRWRIFCVFVSGVLFQMHHLRSINAKPCPKKCLSSSRIARLSDKILPPSLQLHYVIHVTDTCLMDPDTTIFKCLHEAIAHRSCVLRREMLPPQVPSANPTIQASLGQSPNQ